MRNSSIEKYVILFIPWALSLIFQSNPVLSFFNSLGWLILYFLHNLNGQNTTTTHRQAFIGSVNAPHFSGANHFCGIYVLHLYILFLKRVRVSKFPGSKLILFTRCRSAKNNSPMPALLLFRPCGFRYGYFNVHEISHQTKI